MAESTYGWANTTLVDSPLFLLFFVVILTSPSSISPRDGIIVELLTGISTLDEEEALTLVDPGDPMMIKFLLISYASENPKSVVVFNA